MHRWISPTECLPEEFKSVLVAIKYKSNYFFTEAYYDAEDGEWHLPSELEEIIGVKTLKLISLPHRATVRYWIPLPMRLVLNTEI